VDRAKNVFVFNNTVDDVAMGKYEGQCAQLWNINSLSVHNNTFSNCKQMGIWLASVNGGTTGGSINDNCIFDNGPTATGPGITVVDAAPVSDPFDIEDNWWGAADGPGSIGPGSGDTIAATIGKVDFTGWALSALALVLAHSHVIDGVVEYEHVLGPIHLESGPVITRGSFLLRAA